MTHLSPVSTDNTPDPCAQEPIRFPGAIQPHGCVMVLDRGGNIRAASGNTKGKLGLSCDDLLGTAVWQAFGQHEHWLSDLHSVLQTLGPGQACWLSPIERAGLSWEVRATSVQWGAQDRQAMVLLDWLPGSDFTPKENHSLFANVAQSLRGLNESASLTRYLQEAAMAVQRFTGYERVMVYRFEADWSGEVVAEAVADGCESKYLGHRFPATDIPSQARQLYIEQPVRVIADVHAMPVDLRVAPDAPDTPDTLDLGFSGLRAVSPVHLEYLRNMRVGASLVLSLIHQGELWGMLVCHHPTPRLPPSHVTQALCVASELMLGNVTSHVDSLMALDKVKHALKIQQALSLVERSLEHMGRRFVIPDTLQELLGTVGADAISICLEGELLCGDSLPAALTDRLERYWTESNELVFQTHALSTMWPEVCGPDWPYAGVLACRMGEEPRSWVVILRHERVRHIRWAGNPYKQASHPSEQLTPRASFQTWVESVRQQAEPWQEHDKHAVLELMRLIRLRRQSWKVRRYQEVLRSFMSQQEQQLLQDRARMALVVHDQLGQLMAAARFKIRRLAEPAQAVNSKQPVIQSAMDDLEEAMEVARNLAHHLYPMVLRHGLMVALESLVDDISRRCDLPIELDGPPTMPKLKEQVAEVFFSVAREALNNVVRHARASRAKVSLLLGDGYLEMAIEDDGVGFPTGRSPARRQFGMFGMRERARWIDAEFDAGNMPSGGARVVLRWKLPTAEEVAE